MDHIVGPATVLGLDVKSPAELGALEIDVIPAEGLQTDTRSGRGSLSLSNETNQHSRAHHELGLGVQHSRSTNDETQARICN